MLGTEERDELHALSVGEEIRRAAPLRILTGVIGNQPDVLSTERREFLSLQNIEASLHARSAARVFS
jgi:hypothetical protein